MPLMNFGISQVNRPTPQRIAILFDLLASVCGIVSSFFTASTFVSHQLSDIISSVLTGLFIPILLLFKRFFGAEVTETKVSINEVSEIKDK